MPKKIVMSILRICKRAINYLTFAIVPLLTACTSIDELTGLPTGENIIIPFDDKIADWQEFSLEDGNYQFTLWQSPSRGFADSYSLSVAHNEDKKLTEFRQLMDSSGKAQCDNYTSDEVYYPPNKRYPALLWLFSCDNIDGTKAKILHLALQGEDNFYHLQKNWQYNFSEADVVYWKDQFSGAYLCNTEDVLPSCPRIR